MAYENGKQKQAPEQEEKQSPEKQHVPEQGLFSMPNSMMMAMPVPPPGTPNSVMREMLSDRQNPAAEAEADRLSAGVRFGTPNSVRKEMGRRLGSDFSSVRFHTGPESIRRNEAMGARAFTRGSDIFFGRGGFDPQIGAHELVHTVQQGAIPGHVSQSAAYGTVQMFSLRGLFSRISNHFRRKKAAKASAVQEEEPLIKQAEEPVVEASKPEADPIVEAPKPKAEPQDPAAIPDAPKDHDVSSAVESEVKDGLKAEGKDGGEVNDTTARFKKMMDDADAPEVQLQGLMGDAPAASAAAAAEPLVPKAKAPAPNHGYNPMSDTSSTNGSSSALAAAAAAAAEPDVPKAKTPAPPPSIPESEAEPNLTSPPIPAHDEEDEKPAAKTPAPKSPTPPPILKSNDSNLEEEDVFIPAGGTEKIPDWTGEGYDSEEKPVLLPRGGQYHRRSKGTGTVNEGVSWVNLGNNAVKVLKEVDDLSDYAATGELRWGSRGTHTLSYDQGVEGAASPYINGGTSLVSAGTAAVSTVTNAMDTVRHAKNIEAGESGADMVQKGLDTAASAGDVLSSGAKFLGTVGAVTPVAEFVPGVNIAAGTLRTISGASQAIRGGIALHRIKKEIQGIQHRRYVRKHRLDLDEDMDSAPLVPATDEHKGISSGAAVAEEAASPNPDYNPMTDTVSTTGSSPAPAAAAAGPRAGEHAETQEERENRLWQIFHHGKWISEYNRTAGSMKAGSGVLSATSGILTLTGAGAAVGAGLAAANAGLSIGSFAYDKVKKKHIRNRVIAQELGISEKAVEDDDALNTAVTDTNTQQGTEFGGSRKEIFAQINRRRARYLLDLAGRDKAPDGSDPDITAADNVIRALGVHRKKDGVYADGAEELLAEKLQG